MALQRLTSVTTTVLFVRFLQGFVVIDLAVLPCVLKEGSC
jgi:hypothetical protein